jgi:LacI family transcriptional regulator
MTPVKPRLKDIARLAGVSIGTVDRVLHDRGEVAAETKERIKQILHDTKYSPDVAAQALKTGKIVNLVSLLPEPSYDNSFWEKHPAGINRALGELNLFRINMNLVTFDMFNEEDFQLKARDVLSLHPDGVVLAPIFKNESVTFCKQLRESNIPFVFVDGFVENTDYLAFIGEDAYRSGRVAGQLADMTTSEGKAIAVLSIARNIRNVQHLNKRINGFMSYFENSGTRGRKNIPVSIPDPSPLTIKNVLDRTFTENTQIETIYMSGSKSYLIASYLEQYNSGDIHLIGYDLLDRNIEYLKSGRIRFLIGQRPEEQTFRAVKKLFEFLSFNKKPEEMEYLPVDIVTSENADFFLQQSEYNE